MQLDANRKGPGNVAHPSVLDEKRYYSSRMLPFIGASTSAGL